MLIVAHALSNHPNDKQEALPTLQAIAQLKSGSRTQSRWTMDTSVKPTFKLARNWALSPISPPDANPIISIGTPFSSNNPNHPQTRPAPSVKMAYKLQTEIGQAIYRLRKCTVEPIIGIIKEILGFRQFSLRGLARQPQANGASSAWLSI